MVSASITATAFLLMLLPVFGLDVLQRRRRIVALRMLAGIGLASAAYCVVVGVGALSGWDSFEAAVPRDLRNLIAGPGEQAGFAARASAYWPYGLILVGAFWTIVYAATQWSVRRR